MNLPHLSAALLSAAILIAFPVWAGEGHDHGDAAPAAVGQALPRFSAVSETFELVGVLNGKHITLYLDRTADNTPVTDAQIELEVAGEKFKAEKHEDVYEVVLTAEPGPGVLPITATVAAGNEVDLLAGELDHHEEAHTDAAGPSKPWTPYAAWAIGIVAALAALFTIGRRMVSSRQRHAGDAA